MLCSVPFLIATFLVYALIPELHGNNHGKSLMFYALGLSVGYTTLAYTMLRNGNSVDMLTCTILGYITYFSLLFSFFWSNVMCIDIWLTFRSIRRAAIASKLLKKFICYTLYACLSPLSMLLLTVLIDHEVVYLPVDWRPRIGFNRCFLASK
jgi:G protein-coupled receptor Mth (Methuselah protein)